MNIFEEYKNIREQLESLESKEKVFKELILNEIKDKKENLIKTEYGNFMKRGWTTYSYSKDLLIKEKESKEKIKELAKPIEEEISLLRANEIKEGIAIGKDVLTFNYLKNK